MRHTGCLLLFVTLACQTTSDGTVAEPTDASQVVPGGEVSDTEAPAGDATLDVAAPSPDSAADAGADGTTADTHEESDAPVVDPDAGGGGDIALTDDAADAVEPTDEDVTDGGDEDVTGGGDEDSAGGGDEDVVGGGDEDVAGGSDEDVAEDTAAPSDDLAGDTGSSPDATPECAVDGDCAAPACSVAACVDGACVTSPLSCDDGDPCTVGDHCKDGECVTTPMTCDDGDACTTNDRCEGGECVTTPMTCDDDDACTTNDRCEDGGCVSTPVLCDDGDACTTNDHCANGECVTTPKPCDDGDACTTNDRCENGDCVTTPKICDDGDPCTVADRCVAGACTATPTVCAGPFGDAAGPFASTPYRNTVVLVARAANAAALTNTASADAVLVPSTLLPQLAANALVFVELAPTDTATAVLGTLRSEGLAAPGRPAALVAAANARTVLVAAAARLAGPDADLAPHVRLVERFTKGQASTVAAFQSTLIQAAADDGFHAVTFDATDLDLFGKLAFARRLGLATGLDPIPAANGLALLTALRDRVDFVVPALPMSAARATLEADDAQLRLDLADQEAVGGMVAFQRRGGAKERAALGGSAPAFSTFAVGQDLLGGVLAFDRSATADTGQSLSLGTVNIPARRGLVVAVAVNFDALGADLPQGQDRQLAGDSQLGGWFLKLERPSASYQLTFGVRLGSAYRSAAATLASLDASRSYHLVGVYERSTGTVRLLIDGVEAASTTGAAADVTASTKPVLVGADPEDTETRFHFDGKIQRVVVATPGPLGCTADAQCPAPTCGAAQCDVATGQCRTTPPSGKCAFGGACLTAGEAAPGDLCAVCDPVAPLSWARREQTDPLAPWCAGAPRTGELRLTVRTATSANSGTHDLIRGCAGADQCALFDTFPWAYWNENNYHPDDLESLGQTDLYRRPVSLPVIGLDGLSLEVASAVADASVTTNGADAWRPACVSAVLDGALVYCNEGLATMLIGAESGPNETPRHLDNPGSLGCGGCYPAALSHGPMVGRVEGTTARIWARTEYRREVRVRYGAGLETAPVYSSPDDDFVVELTLDGLTPGAVVPYQVFVDGVPASAQLEFRAAPVSGPVVVAFGSCIKNSVAPAEPVFDAVLAQEPDVFLFVGDNHYGNRADYDNQVFHMLRERAVPSQAAVLARASTLAIWDDHDFAGNNTYGATVPDRATALSAFSRYWANGSYGTPGSPGVYSRVRYGPVELFLLDTRYHRDEPGTDGTMLGATQLAWLLDGLAASTAPFKLIASGSRFTLQGSSDSWAEHPTERAALFNAIAAGGIPGVAFLSGDIHRVEIRELDVADTPYPFWEFVSSPLNNDHGSGCSAKGTDTLHYCSGGTSGGVFAVLRADDTPLDPTLRYEVRNATGTLLYNTTLKASELVP